MVSFFFFLFLFSLSLSLSSLSLSFPFRSFCFETNRNRAPVFIMPFLPFSTLHAPPLPSNPKQNKTKTKQQQKTFQKKKKKTGGESRSSEKARLRKGVALLVATPGRLLDHLENTAAFETRRVSWLVLDEADRLLDLGFEAKVAQFVGILESRRAAAKQEEEANGFSPATSAASSAHQVAVDPTSLPPIPERIQTVLVSATMGSAVEGLGGVSLVDPARVGVEKSTAETAAAAAGSDPSSRKPARTAGAATSYDDGGEMGSTIPSTVSQ